MSKTLTLTELERQRLGFLNIRMKGLCKLSRLPVKTKNKDKLEIDKFPLTHFRSISIIDWIGSRRKLSFLWRKITSSKTSTILHIQTPIHFSLWPWEVCQRHRRPNMGSLIWISLNPLGQGQTDLESRAQDEERDPRWLDKDDNLKLLTVQLPGISLWNGKLPSVPSAQTWRPYAECAKQMSAKKWLPFWPAVRWASGY